MQRGRPFSREEKASVREAFYSGAASCPANTILTLTINRPETLNAVNGTLHRELCQVFAGIAADASVDAVVLTGQGRAFSAGGDLEWARAMTDEQVDAMFAEARKIIVDLIELPQPIIAAINGPAAGLGATLALLCDVVFAAQDARISDPHVLIGVTAGDGGAAIWPLLTSLCRAKYYLMTGEALSAEEAERIGLVNRVFPAAVLVDEAHALAQRLCNGSRAAIRSTKFSLNKHLREGLCTEPTRLFRGPAFVVSDDVR